MSFKITIDKDLSANIYMVKISVPKADITSADSDLLEAFGEPEIQVGGSFTGTSDTVVLPPLLRKLPSGFPYAQRFDGNDLVDAESVANAWAATILAALTSAITTLRTMADSFTGQSVTTV